MGNHEMTMMVTNISTFRKVGHNINKTPSTRDKFKQSPVSQGSSLHTTVGWFLGGDVVGITSDATCANIRSNNYKVKQ